MITVVNIRNAPEGYVYIGRKMPGREGSPLGNPYRLDGESDLLRPILLKKYRLHLWEQMQSDTPARRELERLVELAKQGDVHLACWCAPKSCHGDLVKAAIEYLAAQPDWIKCTERLPEEGVVVATKIHDANGLRNYQRLLRRGRLWYFEDESMYVYYTPTHWHPIEAKR